MADVFDFDGEVNAVRFYGNGDGFGVHKPKSTGQHVIVTSAGNWIYKSSQYRYS